MTILTDRLWLLGRWPRVAALLTLGLVIALGMAPLDWWFVAVPGWALVLAVLWLTEGRPLFYISERMQTPSQLINVLCG